MIGPGKALDPNKLFLVSTELFGNGRSSSPSTAPAPLHGPRFPLISVRDYVKPYTAEMVSKLSGVPVDKLKALAELYADPKIKVVSFWTMGFNQHTRGVWANNLVYNIHLLVGKISTPGNSPFSLTGQPSACGTAREVGTFSHRLPADMVVTNPKPRAQARAQVRKYGHPKKLK